MFMYGTAAAIMDFVFFLIVFIVSPNIKIIRRLGLFFKQILSPVENMLRRLGANTRAWFPICKGHSSKKKAKKKRRHEPPVRLPPSRLQDLQLESDQSC